METIEERTNKKYPHPDLSLINNYCSIGYKEGATEQRDIDIEQSKRAICSTCFTLRNNGECKGIEQLADEFEYCEFMKLFLAEMKGETK